MDNLRNNAIHRFMRANPFYNVHSTLLARRDPHQIFLCDKKRLIYCNTFDPPRSIPLSERSHSLSLQVRQFYRSVLVQAIHAI